MSVATNNILKLLRDLSDSADNILCEFKVPPLSQWASIVEKTADDIVESESPSTALFDSEKIPTLMSYLGGTNSSGPRASTMLSDIQRRHLHRSGKKDSLKSFRSRQSSIKKTPLGRKSNLVSTPVKSNTPKLKVPPTIIKKTTIFENKESTSGVLNQDYSQTALKDRTSKRKSSAELLLENVKKPKYPAERENPKIERKPMKASNSSQLGYANIKSSVGTTTTVLKENRTMRSKFESKQDTASKNRKNIMALRHQKLEESKRAREEKMEKSQQRLKLEKQKREKIATPKGAVLKNSVKHDKETSPSSKKLPVNLKQIGSSGILKSNEKTPGKQKKQKPPPSDTKMINTTFAIEKEKPSTSNFKGKTLKEAKIEPQKQQKKGPESYAITPARESFVSYDISEIRSDSEGEDQESNSKPIPSWATGVRLRNALLQQHHQPMDTDVLFGNVFEIPDLVRIMGVKKKHYSKRTSSAVWNSSFSFS